MINSGKYKDPYYKLGAGFGFISQNANVVLYSLPYLVATLGLLRLCFWYFSNRSFGAQLRRYCFAGTFVLMYFAGNVEQFVYFLLGELTTLCSFAPAHRLYNAFVVIFAFTVVLFAFGAPLWWRSSYARKSKHFLDNAHRTLAGVFATTVDGGAICALFGAVHFFLRETPKLQLAVLALL